MKFDTKMAVAGALIAISAYTGISSANKRADAEEALRSVPAYNQAVYLDGLKDQIDNASQELTYRGAYTTKVGKTQIYHGPRYPDPATAAASLEQVAKDEMIDANQSSRLAIIANGLPKQDKIKEYNGQRVNNSTFARQRDRLAGESSTLESRSKSSMDRVPEDLKNEKSQQTGWLVGSVLVGISSLIYAYRAITD